MSREQGQQALARGHHCLRGGDLAGAVAHFQSAKEALGGHPEAAEAAGYLGYAAMRHEAETAARRSVRLNPRYREDAYGEREYLLPDATRSFTYAIEVADGCNLRCPSCPRGNSQQERPRRGLMSLELFNQVIEKIEREKPVKAPSIWLFNWGEPLLNPELPAMIRAIRARGWYVMISSNLSLRRDLGEVIAATPDEFKISLSGFSQGAYEIGHQRGRIGLVKNGMLALRRALDQSQVDTRVWVGFHIYKHNQHEVEATRAFAQSLGFYFHAYPASFTPLEKLADLCEGRIDPEDRGIIDALAYDPLARVAQNRARLSPHKDCELRFNMMSIGVDGAVDLCCSTFASSSGLGVNFLEIDHDALQRMKYAHSFCGRCYRLGLQTQRI